MKKMAVFHSLALLSILTLCLPLQSMKEEDLLRSKPKKIKLKLELQLQCTIPKNENGYILAQFSPREDTIVTTSWDKAVRIWNAGTGKEIRTLKGHKDIVVSAQFDKEGDRIITASHDGTVIIWDAKTGRKIQTLKKHTGGALSAQFIQNGNGIVTISGTGSVRIWKTRTGKVARIFERDPDRITSVKINTAGDQIVMVHGKTATIHNVKTGESNQLNGHTKEITSTKFSPHGDTIVTTSRDGKVIIWDTHTGKKLLILKKFGQDILSTQFDKWGTMVLTASIDGMVTVWDAKMGKKFYELKTPNPLIPLRAAQFSPEGDMVITVHDKAIIVWDVLTGKQIDTLSLDGFPVNSVFFAKFNRDGTKFMFSSDKGIFIVNILRNYRW